MVSGCHVQYQYRDTAADTPQISQVCIASRSAGPSEEVLMAAGLSWFPMVQCFYEQLEAIMEMRVLSRVEQSSPSDDRPLSLGPFPPSVN